MPHLSNSIPEDKDFRRMGMSLSEEFALVEGRRPRILIGAGSDFLTGSLNEICNSFADIGFDVDIAPKFEEVITLANQSLENDSDILLICSDASSTYDKLLDVQLKVKPYQSDLILSLCMVDQNSMTALEEHLKQWIIFKEETNMHVMGYQLLTYLLNPS